MNTKLKLIRSVLFTPASLSKNYLKVLHGPSDCLVYDMEDSVLPENKYEARRNLHGFLNSVERTARELHKTVCVRINCPQTTAWGQDDLDMLSTIQSSTIDAIVIPKVNNSKSIDDTLNIKSNKFLNEIGIWAMIESARGVFHAEGIAAHPTVTGLVFGSNDLTNDIQAKHTTSREPLLYAMSHTILAARSHRKFVFDGVHNDITDPEGLAQSCIQGKELGFDGKSLIHPNQVEVTNHHFSPSDKEIDYAKRVIAAYSLAKEEGRGVCTVDGKLVEFLHVEQAMSVMATAERIGKA